MSQGNDGGPAPEGKRAGQGPRRFDAYKLVAREGQVQGTADPFDFERLHDALGADENGEVPHASLEYRIAGATDAGGRAALDIAIDGEVPLECQRCLRPFLWPVHQQTSVLLARDEDELTYLDDNDEREVILAAAPLDPLELVEDELVLTLPYVARCERPDCVAGAEVGEVAAPGREESNAVEAPAGASPFKALAGLKGGRPKE